MADVITLKDGSVETLLQSKDFEFLVEKYMGYDAEKYFRNYAEIADEEVRAAKAGENTDLESYEASLESNTSCFLEILELIEQMKSILEAPRINKKKLSNLVGNVEKIIKNQI